MTTDMGQPGQIIDGKYRITRLLGTGGMGAVYEGENVRIRRRVAIKMLHASVSEQPEAVTRFEREAQAAAMVGSEHICEVLDMGELPDHTRYLVMEFLEGGTLTELIKRNGRLVPQQSIPIMAQILDALGAAHAAGIIHRDLKPDNIFILPQRGGIQNFVKILDFGVSKFSQTSGESMNVTRAGAVVGTPYYMSPEQARGSSAIDARTDIYAIGVLLYQATTGQVPYNAETFSELLFKIVLEVAPPPQTYVPDLDPEFSGIIQRAMSREPGQRFQSCAQFKEALLQFQAARAAGPRPPGEPMPARTEVLGPARAADPSGASWPGAAPPPQAGQGTQPIPPMFTGANPAAAQPWQAASTPGAQPWQAASTPGAQPWQAASTPGAQPWQAASTPGAQPPTATADSWGNASSPSAGVPIAAKPKSRAGIVVAVIGVAALLGVGAAVLASSMLGKPRAAAPVDTSTATASVATPPPPPPTATASASVEPTASATPSASASPTASAAPTADATTAPTVAAKAPPLTPTKPPPLKPPTKPPTKHPHTKKGAGSDLGY